MAHVEKCSGVQAFGARHPRIYGYGSGRCMGNQSVNPDVRAPRADGLRAPSHGSRSMMYKTHHWAINPGPDCTCACLYTCFWVRWKYVMIRGCHVKLRRFELRVFLCQLRCTGLREPITKRFPGFTLVMSCALWADCNHGIVSCFEGRCLAVYRRPKFSESDPSPTCQDLMLGSTAKAAVA